jgi:hypothetical protein
MKRMNAVAPIVAAILTASSALAAQGGAESESGDGSLAEERMSIYGYAVSLASVDFRELPADGIELGGIAYLRMKGDFKPQDRLFFHVEASYDARAGYQNPCVVADDAGLLPAGSPTSIDSLRVDQAWGSVNAGAFSLQAGKLPIGWGSAYVFNPTQRASRPTLLDPVMDETPGTLAVLPTWSPCDALRLSGYVAFQDKSHRETVAARDGAIENLPFGLRLQTTIGNFDLSSCLIKEVDYVANPFLGTAAYKRSLFAGLDAAGAIWNFGVYAEAALRLPTGEDGLSWEQGDFNLSDALEVAAGFDYLFSAIELELRAEYYHQGLGTSDSSRYDAMTVLTEERLLQGEDYVFGRVEKTFADYFKLSAGGLSNLNDQGAIAMAELVYEALDNLELKIGATIPWGPSGSEFSGRYDLGPIGLGEIDVIRASAYASCKLSF